MLRRGSFLICGRALRVAGVLYSSLMGVVAVVADATVPVAIVVAVVDIVENDVAVVVNVFEHICLAFPRAFVIN